MPRLLDPGDSTRLPLLIGDGLGTTVCRVAMATSGDGSIGLAGGNRVQPGRTQRDPRWARALPWFRRLTGPVGPRGFFAAGGLALVNVGLPLLILRLAARKRRQFNIRSLMVLPLAAAVPLMTFLTLTPSLEVWPMRSAFFGEEGVPCGDAGGDSRSCITWFGWGGAWCAGGGSLCLRWGADGGGDAGGRGWVALAGQEVDGGD